MNGSSAGESARAAHEAQDAVVRRPRGPKGSAIDEALRRYLSAETYDQERKARREDEPAATASPRKRGRSPRTPRTSSKGE